MTGRQPIPRTSCRARTEAATSPTASSRSPYGTTGVTRAASSPWCFTSVAARAASEPTPTRTSPRGGCAARSTAAARSRLRAGDSPGPDNTYEDQPARTCREPDRKVPKRSPNRQIKRLAARRGGIIRAVSKGFSPRLKRLRNRRSEVRILGRAARVSGPTPQVARLPRKRAGGLPIRQPHARWAGGAMSGEIAVPIGVGTSPCPSIRPPHAPSWARMRPLRDRRGGILVACGPRGS
jgi:hypothetical protein